MSELQTSVQTILDKYTSGNGASNVPGAVAYISDTKGNEVAWASSGRISIAEPNPMKKDTIFWIASCSKLLISIAALQLVERGQLNLDDPIDKFLPEAGELKMLSDGSAPRKIPTVRDTMLILSGQACALFNQDLANWFGAKGLPPTANLDSTRASLFTPYASQPGEEWNYGFNIDWAGLAIEVVTGLDLETYYRQNIFEPLGIKDITFKPRSAGLFDRLAASHMRGPDGEILPFIPLLLPEEDKMESIYPGAGLFGNGAEYTKILVALLNGGTHPAGGTILKPETVQLLKKDQLEGKLVDDLERKFDRVIPEVISDRFAGCLSPGLKKNWAYGGLRLKGEYSNRIPYIASRTLLTVLTISLFSCWNVDRETPDSRTERRWWIDFKDGTCGMVHTQMSPFPDKASEDMLAEVESLVHAAYAK
ncbi:beta-lactamase [Pseudozyma hubeiensis SY62]|uniref:Beta-lactamase n=1 Tax=Pseudozyma hubeiensis (strain SY62) TaxID=1305764 RepID=R9NWK5_PSEHS|nr:beta-lactamase [Pseudozyma hubeiensis SY62]GAC92914.1 beta-lactamase [Pseudozyma hubeiensis SY62]